MRSNADEVVAVEASAVNSPQILAAAIDKVNHRTSTSGVPGGDMGLVWSRILCTSTLTAVTATISDYFRLLPTTADHIHQVSPSRPKLIICIF